MPFLVAYTITVLAVAVPGELPPVEEELLVPAAPVDEDAVFDDVEEGTWYSDAIVWANNVGIVKGYDNGSFGVRDNVTREQMVTMLYRYLEMEEYEFEEITEDLDGFVDKDQVSSYAVEAMRWAVQSGLVEGMGHDDLNPKGFAIRAQVATLLVRFCDIVEA